MVERLGNKSRRKPSIPFTERRGRIKTRPDEVYANGNVIREHLYSLPPEVLVIYDPNTYLTITNFGALEWQLHGVINKIILTKSGHTRTICEFEFIAPDQDNDMYQFAIHPTYFVPKNEYPIIKARSLDDLDLAIGLLLRDRNPNRTRKTRQTGISLDENAKAFFSEAATDARTHRHPITANV